MYLGSALLLTSMAIVLGSLTPFLVVPAYGWLLTERVIKPEEGRMWKEFGEEYAEYQARTRRWV